MMKKILILLLVIISNFAFKLNAQMNIPEPKGFVNDYAQMFNSNTVNNLNKSLEDYKQQAHVEIAVVTIMELPDGYTIFDYSQNLFNTWKIGYKGANSGILILISKNNHKFRIHTGYGMESILPDITCREYLDNILRPYFKAEKYDEGICQLIMTIKNKIGNDPTVIEKIINDSLKQKELDKAEFKEKMINFLFGTLYFLLIITGIVLLVRKYRFYKKQEMTYKAGLNYIQKTIDNIHSLMLNNEETEFKLFENNLLELEKEFELLLKKKYINNKIFKKSQILNENLLKLGSDLKVLINLKKSINRNHSSTKDYILKIKNLIGSKKHVIYDDLKTEFNSLENEYLTLNTGLNLEISEKLNNINSRFVNLFNSISNLKNRENEIREIKNTYNSYQNKISQIKRANEVYLKYGMVPLIPNLDLSNLENYYHEILKNVDNKNSFEILNEFDKECINIDICFRELKKMIDSIESIKTQISNHVKEFAYLEHLLTSSGLVNRIPELEKLKTEFIKSLELPESDLIKKYEYLKRAIYFVDDVCHEKRLQERAEQERQAKIEAENRRKKEEERRRRNSYYNSSSSSYYSNDNYSGGSSSSDSGGGFSFDGGSSGGGGADSSW